MENCLCDVRKGVEDAYAKLFNETLDLSEMKKPLIVNNVKREQRLRVKEILKTVNNYNCDKFLIKSAWILS